MYPVSWADRGSETAPSTGVFLSTYVEFLFPPATFNGPSDLTNIVSEALGLSDIGIIVPPGDYDKVDADDYLFDEDNEKIFFLIKSKKDEYCFTNLALIHVDGDSAVSSKRSIRRYEYSSKAIGDVIIETAGTLDMDIELKFTIGDTEFSIDVRKNFIDQLKDIYKALITIGRMQRRDEVSRDNALRCLDVLGSM